MGLSLSLRSVSLISQIRDSSLGNLIRKNILRNSFWGLQWLGKHRGFPPPPSFWMAELWLLLPMSVSCAEGSSSTFGGGVVWLVLEEMLLHHWLLLRQERGWGAEAVGLVGSDLHCFSSPLKVHVGHLIPCPPSAFLSFFCWHKLCSIPQAEDRKPSAFSELLVKAIFPNSLPPSCPYMEGHLVLSECQQDGTLIP